MALAIMYTILVQYEMVEGLRHPGESKKDITLQTFAFGSLACRGR